MKIYSTDSEAELTSKIYMYEGSNFQSVVWGLGIPETLSEGLFGKSYFHNNTEMLFALWTFILLQVYSGRSQRLHDMIFNRVSAGADRRAHPSFIRLG